LLICVIKLTREKKGQFVAEKFRKEVLQIDLDQHSWQEAIEVTGGLLLEAGSIEAGYIQAMIDAVNDLGPYMVVAPHLAIAHAAPAKHVIRNDMVMVIFKEPITFGSENDPVHIMIGLCALNPGSHLEQFQKIADIFDDVEAWKKLYDCVTVEQLYQLMNA